MSYKTRVKSAGLSAALAAKNAGMFPEVATYEQLQALAAQFGEDAYEPEAHLEDLIAQIGELLMKCDEPLKLAAQIQAELDVFQEQMPLHLAKNEAQQKAN
jgi:hypothetical protein